jgi:hypothetical protein
LTDRIDWSGLAARLREVDARPEFASTEEGARHAVELLIGEDRLRQAVDEFVADPFGSTADLIEGVLRAIWPPSMAAYCHAISRSGADVRDRQAAVILLRYVADRRALPWIDAFLDDPDLPVLGLEVLDWLLRTRQVEPDDCEELLRRGETHHNSHVRSRAAMLREHVDRRRGIDSQGTRGLAIATQRGETLIGLNATHYVSLVVTRTFYHRGHRDRVLVQKAPLSHEQEVEKTLLRETYTAESGATEETRRTALDLADYLATHDVTPALSIVWWPADDYHWEVADEGLAIKLSADSPIRAVVVPMGTLRRLLPQVTRDTRVLEVSAERGCTFALLQQGRAAWHGDVFQKLVPIPDDAFGQATTSLHAARSAEREAPGAETPAGSPPSREPAPVVRPAGGLDWSDLERQVFGDPVDPSRGMSSGHATRAVELILGEARLRRAVDDYVAGHEARGLIRAVLAHVQPPSAMFRCVEVCRTAAAPATRRAAVELLTAIADRSVLPGLDELLGDADEEIRALGLDALDALLRGDVVWPEDCEERLPRLADHPDARVRAKVAALRDYLARLSAERTGDR